MVGLTNHDDEVHWQSVFVSLGEHRSDLPLDADSRHGAAISFSDRNPDAGMLLVQDFLAVEGEAFGSVFAPGLDDVIEFRVFLNAEFPLLVPN